MTGKHNINASDRNNVEGYTITREGLRRRRRT
jgi:hypothetical protein